MYHNNLLEGYFSAGDAQDHIENHRGFNPVGFGCQQHAKRVRDIKPITVLVPLFMEEFVVILKRNDLR